MINKRFLIAVVAGLVLAWLVSSMPVMAEEASTDAGVEVLPTEDISYGFKVTDSRNVVQRNLALGAPDNEGATILLNGWISIQLHDKVTDPVMISVWTAHHGWQHSKIKVYISEDGRKWKQAGQEKTVAGHSFQRLDFTGNYKNVKYIKVSRSGGAFSWLLLDAVGAKRG